MVTANPDQDKVAGIEAGADDLIVEPFDRHDLLPRVRSLLRIKSYHDTITRQAAELAKLNRTLEDRVADLRHTGDVTARHRRWCDCWCQSRSVGRWRDFRFLLGQWCWMLLVYVLLEDDNRVIVVTLQDARSSTAATAERSPTAVLIARSRSSLQRPETLTARVLRPRTRYKRPYRHSAHSASLEDAELRSSEVFLCKCLSGSSSRCMV